MTSRFTSKLLCPDKPRTDGVWAFVVLPKKVSETLTRRGRTTVKVVINGYGFESTLEPDGQLSHWLRIKEEQGLAAGADIGDVVTFEITPLVREPEPEVPSDLHAALDANPQAQMVWEDTSTIARLDWIHWIVSARQAKTREKRIRDACDKLSSGKRRVCCFDPSGFYSKALRAPKAAQ